MRAGSREPGAGGRASHRWCGAARVLWPLGGSIVLSCLLALPAACQRPDTARTSATRRAAPPRAPWDEALARGRLPEAEQLLRAAVNGPEPLVAQLDPGVVGEAGGGPRVAADVRPARPNVV